MLDLETYSLLLNKVNVDALTILTLLFAQDYQNKPATLINISSWNGYSVTQGNPIYSATKFYASALSEALYWELKQAKYQNHLSGSRCKSRFN